jgi:hypothetical protein
LAQSTSSTATVPVSTTQPLSPTVPAVIDAAYIQQVINRLDVVYGDAFRALEADRAISDHVKALLADAFVGRALNGTLADFGREAQTGFTLVRPNPGDPSASVLSVASADPKCVVTKTVFTFDQVYRPGFNTSLPDVYFSLLPAAPSSDGVNSTGWRVAFDGARQDGSEPANICSLT